MREISLLILLLPALALAEMTPARGVYDSRVRVVDYNPMNVVKLSTFYGVSTHIEFSENETIKDLAVGDDQAWMVKPRRNHLFIKPKATRADTNITVITDKRTYQFALVIHTRSRNDARAWADPNLIFSLKFRYPDEENLRFAKRRNKEEIAARLKHEKPHNIQQGSGNNDDYWVAGSEEISPTSAYDDGRFIYLEFENNKDMPAIYSVDTVDGEDKESLVNTNVINNNTIVVERLLPRLMLRKGGYVASVINKSFNINGGTDNLSGTISPDVIRSIKGEE